jgi:hypothetical protein
MFLSLTVMETSAQNHVLSELLAPSISSPKVMGGSVSWQRFTFCKLKQNNAVLSANIDSR